MRARAIALFVAGLTLSASMVLPDLAWGQSPAGDFESRPIGKILTASGPVTVEHTNAVVVQAVAGSGGTGQGKVGDFVYRGDVVQTGAGGTVGIAFTDGTAFNLSSNARIALNEFVYDPKGKSNSTLFSLSKGTFTFVAGKVAKTGNMKIDTPVATMGIRGTTPRVEIRDDGTVAFSTLIEEHKGKATERRGGVDKRGGVEVKQRQAKSGSPPDTSAAQTAEKNSSTSSSRFVGAVEPRPMLWCKRLLSTKARGIGILPSNNAISTRP